MHKDNTNTRIAPRTGNTLVALCAALVMLALIAQGCASRGGLTYTEGEVRQVQSILYGTVQDVQQVTVDQDPSLFGAGVGGVVGGVLGSLLGSGGGRTLATLGGAAIGALGGAAVESGVRSYKATQITVNTDNGKTLIIVQGNDEFFVRGDRVRVIINDDGQGRVQHV
ncbi:glycine zipper 2TM domain-containing protein [Desulfovibrio sp. OttesenSCG-928-A18]|nr:glycine zipper 2TM domain-containing protein [Desulfovibrio sp. OttesenSCG-928-A18]